MKTILKFLGITLSSAAVVITGLYFLGRRRIQRQEESFGLETKEPMEEPVKVKKTKTPANNEKVEA